jgi:esterase/lipase superfamily enzyme
MAMFANKMTATAALLGLALAPALSGCSSVGMAEAGSNLGSQMQANVSSGVANVGGLFSGGADAPAYSTRLFVASTRKGGNHSAELTPGAVARYALDTITVPPGHEAGGMERPNWGAPDPRRHIALASHSSLEDHEFRNQLAAQISGRVGVARDVLVYVHGFNTSLDEARFRLAQLVVDGNFAGVPVLFTWPSKSALLAYGADKESATASRDAYLKLLNEIAATPGVGRVHILAHSMGTWLTMETLRGAALSGSPDLGGKLGQVLLAAPDIDLSVFRQQMSRLDASRFSIFVSKGDRALQLSAGLQGDRRLGSLDPGSNKDRALIETLGVAVYDISEFSSGLIGHDNYANAPQVVSQIGARLSTPSGEASQAVIDAGADRSVRPDPRAITASDLPPPPEPQAGQKE